jgi:MOSC domain-containing protein YiiM
MMPAGIGQIVSIVYTPDRSDYVRPEDRYARTAVESVELLVGRGIAGDRKGKYKDREINLMAAETIEVLATEGFKTSPGELGEQIVVRGIDVDRLNPGDRIRLGKDAILEVDEARNGCDRFESIQGLPKSKARGRLGQMMRVIKGADVRVGDLASVLPASA